MRFFLDHIWKESVSQKSACHARCPVAVHSKGSRVDRPPLELSLSLSVHWGRQRSICACLGPDMLAWVLTCRWYRYPYKFIMDGVWSYDADKWMVQDGDNINNVVEVLPEAAGTEAKAARQRILSTGGLLTDAELKAVRNQLELD